MDAFPGANDAARVAALRRHGLLDTPEEERFDSIVQMAARLFGTPMAALSLVDAERQYFKARVGLAMCETSRDMSFCSHAIMSSDDDIFVVDDATEHPVLCDNPLVLGPPYIRFYAGAVIRDDEGWALGTLCIIDTSPRGLSGKERTLLAMLGRRLEEELPRRAPFPPTA